MTVNYYDGNTVDGIIENLEGHEDIEVSNSTIGLVDLTKHEVNF